MASKKKWVVVKGDKFATVGGGLGSRPKVYSTIAAAEHDINTVAKLRGGVVKVHEGDTAVVPSRAGATEATNLPATTSRAKAATGGTKATPKRAAAGK